MRATVKGSTATCKQARTAVRRFALALPGAHEDFPWGESVAKVGKKVFVFLGRDDQEKAQASPAKQEHVGVPGSFGICVKLPASGKQVLGQPFARPADYGLGAKGWVAVEFAPGSRIPLDDVKRWVLESYRAVAPKRMLQELDPGP
jgi:predicted DNA-binding protein (MmcQ/YjbR family)